MSKMQEIRSKTLRKLYTGVLKPILFQFDPEEVHKHFIKVGKTLGNSRLTKKITRKAFDYQNPMLSQKLLGIKFRNPIGLSAGFDKNAESISIMEDVGFGFVEAGSITAKSSLGNPGKRIIRIPEKKSLWIYIGLANKGVNLIYTDLKNKKFKIPYGISIAKTNCKETVDEKTAVRDYIYSLDKLRNLPDYFTINISCPNAFGGQPFNEPRLFEMLFKEIDKLKIKKPIFVKMSPDLSKSNIDKIITLSKKHKVSGFICTNLTKKNTGFDKGGLSGKAVDKLSDEMISNVYKQTRNWKSKPIIIGVGGIFTAEDAYRKIKLGASLLQLITGMIYEGPGLIGEINLGLVKLLKKDGFRNISEAVGKGQIK